MNILFIANKIETGGAPKSMQSLILKLKENNNIIVVTPKKENIYKFCKKNDITVIKTYHDAFLIFSGNTRLKKVLRTTLIPILKIRHYILNKLSAFIVSKKIDMDNIDIIHTNFYRDDLGGMLAKKFNKVHIVHLREFGSVDYNCISLVSNKIKYLNGYTTKFIAISQAIKDYYIKLGLESNKVELIYNGIDNLKINKHIPRSDGKIKIVFVGNLTDEKGQMDLLNSISLIDKKIKNDYYIDFYGKSDVQYKKNIEKFIVDNNMENNVNIYEYVNNIYDILKNYDVGMMCSKSEAFGRVTVEYMAAGLITVASNCGANPEIIDDKKNGFLYDKGNLNTLTSILEKIYYNDYDEIKNNAIETVNKRFTSKINYSNVQRLYFQCLKEKED